MPLSPSTSFPLSKPTEPLISACASIGLLQPVGFTAVAQVFALAQMHRLSSILLLLELVFHLTYLRLADIYYSQTRTFTPSSVLIPPRFDLFLQETYT